MTTMDWSVGEYEHAASRLMPAARVIVDRAGIAAGERVLDVGCGTGNASLLAASLGAVVTGVDPAPRLVEVARLRAPGATFIEGDAIALPFPDASFDVVMSAFGVMFAPDAHAAAAELARVCAPGGRLVLASWIPEGPVAESVRLARDVLFARLGRSAGPSRYPWHDASALAALLRPLGFEPVVSEESLSFTGTSAARHFDEGFSRHPMWAALRGPLERVGALADVRSGTIAILERWNEDPDGFRISIRYALALARRVPS